MAGYQIGGEAITQAGGQLGITIETSDLDNSNGHAGDSTFLPIIDDVLEAVAADKTYGRVVFNHVIRWVTVAKVLHPQRTALIGGRRHALD